MDRLLAGVDAAAGRPGHRRRRGRRRRDHDHRHRRQEAVAQRDGWSVGGMAKGAGMLAPALATMLVVVTTDAVVDAADLDGALRAATATTFDRVDSDGCMSTNDTVVLLASGASGVEADADRAHGRRHRRSARPRPPARRRRRGRPPRHRRRGALGGQPRTTRSRWPARSPATTSSSAPCSATTPTGAGCSRRSARPRPRSTRHRSTSSMNGVQVCRAGGWARTAPSSTSPAREVHVLVDLHAGDATRDGLDQRPHPRLRPRELRLLHLSADA